ncbi:hypothetical protein CYMTET_47627 [Cymbomonas tetramitiformis]|uniref:Methyltransferase domain-containing protein n=1 Tax=Cymbomonas tetramitiformis TaxID=36881 RepID=A0AAE0BVS6_9CHLO|nr:hypothetical protein CYMTET_47627 [Cymbomonas tetramitiformis]
MVLTLKILVTLQKRRFVGYSAMQVALNEHLPRENKVVLLGTGLSLLGEEMMLDGYKLVDAIDYSEPCIKRMRNRQEKLEGLEKVGVNYQVMDVTQMEYKDESIPSVLDKATIDTMFNNEDNLKSVHSMLAETVRILEHDGLYVCLSYGDPDSRLEVLQDKRYDWKLITSSEIKKNKAVFYLYVLQKNNLKDASETAAVVDSWWWWKVHSKSV